MGWVGRWWCGWWWGVPRWVWGCATSRGSAAPGWDLGEYLHLGVCVGCFQPVVVDHLSLVPDEEQGGLVAHLDDLVGAIVGGD